MLDALRAKNTNLQIKNIDDDAFLTYGKIVKNIDMSQLVDYVSKNIPIPETGVKYVPSVSELESIPACKLIEEDFFGCMPIQVGYTNGNSQYMNALEWHKSSELVVAVTDLVVILGKLQDVKQEYLSDNAEIFYVPSGTAIELYATTLHYAPCMANPNGYKSIVVLPKNTNTPLECDVDNDFIKAKNKWVIGHPDNAAMAAFPKKQIIKGDNIFIDC